MRLTDLDELLNKAVNLEDIALKQVNTLNPNDDPIDWAIWMAVLVERTAFKEFLMDAPTIEPIITEEQVKEYCRKRCLVVITSEMFHRMIEESEILK